jgi:hypothetical protein
MDPADELKEREAELTRVRSVVQDAIQKLKLVPNSNGADIVLWALWHSIRVQCPEVDSLTGWRCCLFGDHQQHLFSAAKRQPAPPAAPEPEFVADLARAYANDMAQHDFSADTQHDDAAEPLVSGMKVHVIRGIHIGDEVTLRDYSAIDGKWSVELLRGTLARYAPRDLRAGPWSNVAGPVNLRALLERDYNPPPLFIFEEVELGSGYHSLHVSYERKERDWSAEPYKKSSNVEYRNRVVRVPYPPVRR